MRKISRMAVVGLTVAVLLTPNMHPAKAELGPVHVELNTTGDKPGGVRANTVTAFKVHFRFNINIKVHDWLKVWFPIDEASCNPKDICDGLPKITGNREHQRFVPNEKYFAKYPNSDEKDFGKLYQVLEDRYGNTRFDECECATEGNCCSQGKCRVVADPSGLGCWIMGTVLPQLPRDEKERYYRLVRIIYSTVIGYTPDGESQGLPFITNTCKERSYQMNSPLEIDAWRKGYNPMDFNTSKATGILAPATPGRYIVLVATKPEPTPVESETFVLPCSQLSTPKVEFTKMNTDYAAPIKVGFSTGEGGALDKDSSSITIRFPEQFQLPNPDKIKPSSVLVNGQKVTKKLLIDRDKHTMTITSPAEVNSFSNVEIEIGKEVGIRTPKVKGNYKLEVCTDSEPELIPSDVFSIELVPSAYSSPNTEFFEAGYSLLGNAPKKGIEKVGEIAVIFPEGTQMPAEIDARKITINNIQCVIKPTIDGNKLLIKTPVAIERYIDIDIEKCGIMNPTKGAYKISYSYKDEIFDFGFFEIKASEPYINKIEFTNPTNCEKTGIKIMYYPSTSAPIKIGDKITIEFPDDFKLPGDGNIKEIKVNQTIPLSFEIDRNFLHIYSGKEADFKSGAEIAIGENFSVINSIFLKTCKLIIHHNGAIIFSPEISLMASQPRTEIEIRWPESTKSSEFGGYTWYNKPPVISFYACNPNQWIYYYFSNKDGTQFDKEINLDEGIYLCNLYYYGIIDSQREETNLVTFAIDSYPTVCIIDNEISHLYTNKMSYRVVVNRHFNVIDNRILDADTEKDYIIDGIKINDELIANPEISKYSNDFNLRYIIEKDIPLKEGDNVIEIASFDQFGDSDTKKITVTRDTKPPQMSITSPRQNCLQIAGGDVEISVETEADAEIDLGSGINIEDILENGALKTYKAKLPVKIGKNEIAIGVHDRAGNWTTKKLVFYGLEPIVSEFFLGATNWTLNGKEQARMKSAPTASSPPLPKDLAGATYIPAADIGFALSAKVFWDAKAKKATLSQSLPNGTTTLVEVWIGNKKAKVNGKEVWIDDKHRLYPTIVNGKTMLPLRFVAENLGADVAFDAPTKKITVRFPSEKIIGKQEGR